jgi:hypothetical protein
LSRRILVPITNEAEALSILETGGAGETGSAGGVTPDFYSRLEHDGIGGGFGFDTWKSDASSLAEACRTLKNRGVRLYYQMDGACQNNLEMTKGENRKMRAHAAWITDSGFAGVIVTNPYIASMISAEFAPLEIIVGLTAMVDALPRLAFWFELGARMAILDYNLNRDMEVLEAIPKSDRERVFIAPNIGCFYSCPRYRFCLNNRSHLSRGEMKKPHDSWRPECASILAEDPQELMRSPWLPPDGLQKIEDTGLTNLYLLPASVGSKALFEAYSSRKPVPDLSKLLSFIHDPGGLPSIDAAAAKAFIEAFPRSCHLVRCSECRYCDTARRTEHRG